MSNLVKPLPIVASLYITFPLENEKIFCSNEKASKFVAIAKFIKTL
jgi:hypothetical protein